MGTEECLCIYQLHTALDPLIEALTCDELSVLCGVEDKAEVWFVYPLHVRIVVNDFVRYVFCIASQLAQEFKNRLVSQGSTITSHDMECVKVFECL